MYVTNRTETSDASTYPPKKHIHTATNCKSFNYKTAKNYFRENLHITGRDVI